MSHHSTDKPLTEIIDEVSRKESDDLNIFKRNAASLVTQVKAEQLKSSLGPTNDYPAGKISPQDEGGLMMGIANFNGRVVIDFGKPVHSIGFTKKEAVEFAEMLISRAESCPTIIGE